MDESRSSTESMPAPQPEPRIGSYRVLGPLGTGGMSSVFRAVHIEGSTLPLADLGSALWALDVGLSPGGLVY